jgi:hypothetical protein
MENNAVNPNWKQKECRGRKDLDASSMIMIMIIRMQVQSDFEVLAAWHSDDPVAIRVIGCPLEYAIFCAPLKRRPLPESCNFILDIFSGHLIRTTSTP